MTYDIEISFDISKCINITLKEMIDNIKMIATNNFCEQIYEDFEFESKTRFYRRHCILFIKFANENINYLTNFLNNIKKIKNLHIELIYDDINRKIVYASKYFITQKMDKYISKKYKKERSYSDDEIMILNSISKLK